jgi:hypothetical protein
LPPGTVIVAVLLVVALVIGAAWWFFGRQPAPRPRPSSPPTVPAATVTPSGPTSGPTSQSPGPSSSPAPPGSSLADYLPVPPGAALPLGRSGLAGDFEYVVNSVQLSHDPIFELFPPQGVFVIVNLTVTLRGTAPTSGVFYNSDVAVLEVGGTQHMASGHSVMFEDALTVALLEPNQPVRGNIVFDLPPDATAGAVLIGADFTLGRTVKLDLGLT